MEYITAAEAAEKWGVTSRQVQRLLADNRIPAAKRYGRTFAVPADAKKPDDSRKEKQPPPQKSLADELLEINEAAADAYGPRDNPDAILDTTDNERYKILYIQALAYFRGDFEQVINIYNNTEKDDALKITLAGYAIAAVISTGNYPLYKEIETYLKNMAKGNEGTFVSTVVEQLFASVYVSVLAPNMAPDWLKTGNFPALPKRMMISVFHKRAQYLMSVRNYEAMLAVTQTAIAVYDIENEMSASIVYLWVLRVVACVLLNREDEARRYLSDAVNILFPAGLITPFAEYLSVFGHLLKPLAEQKFPKQYDAAAKQWQRTVPNWYDFHNKFTKEHITLVLSLRDYQIAWWSANGASYAQIGEMLHISEGRVKNLLDEICEKLFITGRNRKKVLKSFVL